MSDSRPVEVVIGGHKLLVSSDHPAEYTKAVADHFDQAVQRIRAALPTVDAHRAAILAGLAVTDELFQAQRAEKGTAARVRAVAARLEQLVGS
ncbi:MAG: cell division protein ZapA [Gemmatimonadales bacterium]|nr:cell division protein ZapA [Gemmatimonadales bacterium]